MAITTGSQALASDVVSGANMPSGFIGMWHGLIANIPSGWLLCDGTSGTPDLRDRFVKGAAAATEAGATGGATSVTSGQTSGNAGDGAGGNTLTQETHTHSVATQPPFYVILYIMKT